MGDSKFGRKRAVAALLGERERDTSNILVLFISHRDRERERKKHESIDGGAGMLGEKPSCPPPPHTE